MVGGDTEKSSSYLFSGRTSLQELDLSFSVLFFFRERTRWRPVPAVQRIASFGKVSATQIGDGGDQNSKLPGTSFSERESKTLLGKHGARNPIMRVPIATHQRITMHSAIRLFSVTRHSNTDRKDARDGQWDTVHTPPNYLGTGAGEDSMQLQHPMRTTAQH